MARPDVLALLCLATLLVAAEPWEKDLAAYEAMDRATPPAAGSIACVGSSSFVRWHSLTTDLAPLPVYNRAFGGSTTADQLPALPRIVLPHRPAVIVYYCGDNDLASPDADPQRPVHGFQDFVAAVHVALPATRIVYVSIKPSPARSASWPAAEKANTAIKAWCAAKPLLSYVDIAGPMLDGNGNPQERFFASDHLHLSDDGYRLWTATIKPAVEAAWALARPHP